MNNKLSVKTKIFLVIFLIIILFSFITIAIIFIKLNKNDKQENNSSYAIIKDLDTVSDDNIFKKKINKLNFGKIAKCTGIIEGLFDMGNEDIYKITVNTNNMLMYVESRKNFSRFKLTDTSDNNIELQILCLNDSKAYNEITSKNDNKGTEYNYQGWTFCKIKGGSICYYKLERNQSDNAIIYIGIQSENIKDLNEEDFNNVSKKIIDCFKIEYYEKKDNNNINKYVNMLFSTDIQNLKLSNNVKLDLITNSEIEQVFNNYTSSMGAENTIQVLTKKDKYTFYIYEHEITNKEWLDYYYDKSLNLNTLNYKGMKFYVLSKAHEFLLFGI